MFTHLILYARYEHTWACWGPPLWHWTDSSSTFETSWPELAIQIFLNSAKNVANICHVTRNSCVIAALTG